MNIIILPICVNYTNKKHAFCQSHLMKEAVQKSGKNPANEVIIKTILFRRLNSAGYRNNILIFKWFLLDTKDWGNDAENVAYPWRE